MVFDDNSVGDDAKALTAAARYEDMQAERAPYLNRGRECSRLTIPSLLPPEGHSGHSSLYQPFQSTGADGVNNLAAKLLMALFPPGTPFFKLSLDDYVVQELKQNVEGEDARAELEAALGKVERATVGHMEKNGARQTHFEALLHLIVAGNGLIHVGKDGKEKFFKLDRYCVARDLDGNVLEIVTEESVDKEALPANIRAVVDASAAAPAGRKASNKDVLVYTWVRREENSWKVVQEVCGEVVPGSEGTYPLDKSAWIPLRWSKVSGESYGRGRCEEYLGDLYSLESASKAIIQFAAAVSKIVALVNEAGVTSKEDLARAESGAVLDGDAKDVTFLMVEKGQDFQVAKAVADGIQARLERAFLMAHSIQRQAERVTAEEIRLLANELEQGLGGVYSILSEEFQRPLVTRLLAVLSKNSKTTKIPKLPEGTVAPQIVTGLDGLGRNTDMVRLDTLIAGVAQQFGPEAVAQYVNLGAYMIRRATSLGIDVSGLIRTEAQIQQQQQAQQQQSMAEKLGGPAIKAMSDQMMAARQSPPQTPPEGIPQQ